MRIDLQENRVTAWHRFSAKMSTKVSSLTCQMYVMYNCIISFKIVSRVLCRNFKPKLNAMYNTGTSKTASA